MAENKFIAVVGNIGAGKSTLTAMLAAQFNWEPFYEANAENPYLADFYVDMQRWSFHSQVFFLGKRLEHHRQLLDHPGSVIQDRTVYEDAEIFARNLAQQGLMSGRDYDAYQRLYKAVASFLPPPDLVIYLEASVKTLIAHIQRRGRAFEQNMDPAYLERLNLLYDKWIKGWSACPVLRVSADDLDFQYEREHFLHIVSQIENTMRQPTSHE